MPTFGSLFAGIGGLDLGLERAGLECRWQVEVDEYCLQVLRKHWPEVPKYGEVETCHTWETCSLAHPEHSDDGGLHARSEEAGGAHVRRAPTRARGERALAQGAWDPWSCGGWHLAPVDLVCGGFPCQPVSQAGKHGGTADERWLWPQYRRVLSLLRPRFVLVENVPGLLTIDGGALFAGVLGDLAALGYDAEWESIPAAAFGAPHLRYRVFIVAYRHELADAPGARCGTGQPSPSGTLRDGARRAEPERRSGDVADALAIGRAGGADNQGQESAERNGFTASSLADSDGGRCEQRDQRERGLPVSDARRETPDTASPRSPQRSDEEELRQQSPIERAGVVPDSAWWDRGRGDDRRGRGVEGDGASRIFGSGHSLRTYADECWEWWATEPDVGRVAHGVPARVDRLKALGNAVVPQVAAYIGRRILEAFALG